MFSDCCCDAPVVGGGANHTFQMTASWAAVGCTKDWYGYADVPPTSGVYADWTSGAKLQSWALKPHTWSIEIAGGVCEEYLGEPPCGTSGYDFNQTCVFNGAWTTDASGTADDAVFVPLFGHEFQRRVEAGGLGVGLQHGVGSVCPFLEATMTISVRATSASWNFGQVVFSGPACDGVLFAVVEHWPQVGNHCNSELTCTFSFNEV